MKRFEYFIWPVGVILALGLGIYAGHKVTTAYKDTEIKRLEATVKAAEVERDFWRWTLKGLAEGNQLAGVDLKGRPSTQD